MARHVVTHRLTPAAGDPRPKVLTVSDGVADGYPRRPVGQALVARLAAAGYDVVDHRVTADGVDAVASALRDLAAGFAGLVVTTGGTGFGRGI